MSALLYEDQIGVEQCPIHARPYQEAAVNAVFEQWHIGNRSTLAQLPTGTGKSQPVTSQVLTPRGWYPIGYLQVGDSVIGSEGSATEVLGVFPQGTLEVYTVTMSDGTQVECSADHLWSVQTKDRKWYSGKFTVKRTIDLMGDLSYRDGSNKWFLPIVEPVHFEEKEVPLDPYLLGVIIGDGGVSISGRVIISSADQEVLSLVSERLPLDCCIRHIGRYDYGVFQSGRRRGEFRRNSVIEAIRELGLENHRSEEKFVPCSYLYNSIAVRSELLRGLMDTDGTITKEGHSEFNTTSSHLASDVEELIRSLGGVVQMRKRRTEYTYNGKKLSGLQSYRLTVSLPSMNPFRLLRKATRYFSQKKQGNTKAIVKIEKTGKEECVCIRVAAADSLYVTEGYNLTHNTVCGALIARRFPEHRGRVLVLANRDELIRQWDEAMRFVCNNDQIEIEHGDKKASRNKHSLRRDSQGKKRAFARIVVASKDSMWREKRLNSFGEDEFGLIIVDEASGYIDDNPTWHNIVSRFPGANVVGFDAYPKRSDGKAMGRVFDSVACEYSILQAVDDGWLCRPDQQYIMVDGFDLGSLQTVKGKDWSEMQLERMLRQERPLQAMAQQTVDFAVSEGHKKRPGHILSTLIFNASVDLARLMADILNRRHGRDGTGRAAVISSRDTDIDKRRRILSEFEEGKIKYLSNYGVAVRGYDNPNIEMVVMGRPTKFEGLAVQMVGRATRPLREITDALNHAGSAVERRGIIAASRKANALILDPVGTSGVHSLAIDLVDILGGDYGEAVIRECKRGLMQSDGKFTREELEEAKKRVQALETDDLKSRQDFIVDSTYTSRSVDPFSKTAGGATPVKQAKERPTVPSPAQIAYIRKHAKLPEAELDRMSFGDAGRMMGEIARRYKFKLCSIPQMRLLISKGVREETARNMSRVDADALITSIKNNGWRLPDSYEG